MAILSGRTAEDVAGMLDLAATGGSSTGALSMLDEAALAFRASPGVAPALTAFSAARLNYQSGTSSWDAVARAALALADALRPLGTARVPDGFNE
jgi:hypothetical protein